MDKTQLFLLVLLSCSLVSKVIFSFCLHIIIPWYSLLAHHPPPALDRGRPCRKYPRVGRTWGRSWCWSWHWGQRTSCRGRGGVWGGSCWSWRSGCWWGAPGWIYWRARGHSRDIETSCWWTVIKKTNILISSWHFYQIQVSLGSDIWARMSPYGFGPVGIGVEVWSHRSDPAPYPICGIGGSDLVDPHSPNKVSECVSDHPNY